MKGRLLSIVRKPWGMIPVLWTAWFLLLIRLDDLSMWIDEWFTVDIIHTPWSTFISHIIATERRPPLHYALLKIWASCAGDSEFVLRFYSVAVALLAVAGLYVLGRCLLNYYGGLAAAFLLTASPFAVLYSRMIRAYPQTMLLGSLTILLLLRALAKPSRGRWIAYGLALVGLLYTDYSGLAIAGGQALWVLLQRPARQTMQKWGLALSGVALTYLPWLPALLIQRAHPARLTDLATGIMGFLLKTAYPLYSWGAGETIFPWHPAALPSALSCSLLLGWTLAVFWKRARGVFWLIVSLLGVTLVFTATLMTFAATDIPFINAASRNPAGAPIFYLGVAAGLSAVQRRWLRWIAGLLIGVAFACGLWNYYHGQQFHNPIYAVPIRQVVEEVRSSAGPDDLIIAEPDTLFGYYYQRNPGPATYRDVDDRIQAYVEHYRPRRVWLVTFGRDSTAPAVQTEKLSNWLNEQCFFQTSSGYVPQSLIYQELKRRLVHRPPYAYKLLTQIFVCR